MPVRAFSAVLWVALETVASRAEAQCPNGSPPPCVQVRATIQVPSAEARMRRFLLLPFRNVTRTEQQEWLVTGAPLIIAEALGQFQDLTVIPEEVTAAARRRLRLSPDGVPDAAQLRQLAEETGGWTAVTGNLYASAGRTRVTIQAMDVPTSRVIARAETAVGADEDVRGAFRTLSLKLLEPAGVRAASQEGIAFATTSLDAYRAYARGHAAYHRSRYREAHAAFNEAIRLDSGFALAWAGLAANGANIEGLEALINPFSSSYRAVEMAARLADRMPPRQARFIRGIQALFRGEIMLSRRLIDSLAATDPNDLDAHLWLASSELMTPLLDTTGAELRPIGSWNRVIAVARHILDRDPGRRNTYLLPAFAHAIAGGLWWGDTWGKRRESGTLAMMLITKPDGRFVPVLRDTFEFVTRAKFDSLPASERTRLRVRAAQAGMTYVERWIAAGPDDAEARLWASRLAELSGEPARALRELEIADSLGVQSGLENIAGRRLMLLVQAQRYADAGRFADSLLATRQLAQRPFLRFLDRRRQSAVAAFLLSRQWESASRLAEIMGSAGPNLPSCSSLRSEITDLGPESLPHSVLQAVADTVARHFSDVSASAGLSPCAEELRSLGIDSSATAHPVESRPPIGYR